MKIAKRTICVMLSAILIGALFAGCSSNKDEKYSDTTLIIGYTEEVQPFLKVNEDGTATGFSADLWEAIFDDIKGDLKTYRFEKVEKGYALEEDGGFTDSDGKVYSAGLLMGAVTKNDGTFNEDYSFTEPIISDRIIAVTKGDSKIKDYAGFEGARVLTVSDVAASVFEKHSAISSSCKSVKAAKSVDEALAALDSGEADAVVTDEFSFNPSEKAKSYTVLEHELDTIEYVIACAKYSGWKDSINTAIYELKSPEYNDADEFTPLVEKYFGYYASSFDFEPESEKK